MTKSSFKTRRIYTGTGVCIEKAKGMVKTVRPKLNVNICTNKLGTNTVCNCWMGASHRAKLMTAIRTSKTDSNTVTLKELAYFCRTIFFSCLIKTHISSVVLRKAVASKLITTIVQRNSLGLESFNPNVLGEVVYDEQPRNFTMNSKTITRTLDII